MENSLIKRFFPASQWLPRYQRSWLAGDAIAGLTVWGLIVPQAMAYAGVAGLPLQFGLYTLLVSLFLYALLGTSRHLVVQPTSATSALIASSVTTVLVATGIVASGAEVDPAIYQQYALAFVLVVGIVFLAAGLARLGWITQFLSKPVLDGFVTGLAVFVLVGQLHKIFGVEKGSGNTVQKFITILRELPDTNLVTLAIGAGALILLFLLPKWNRKLPAGLIILFGSIALSTALSLESKYGVNVVGEIPQGLPSLELTLVPLQAMLAMIPLAIGVLLVAFSQTLGTARQFADQHNYEVDPNQELIASGLPSFISSLAGGMIAGGSMSASAVNEGAGSRSQVSNLFAWGATILTVLFLTPIFQSLPEAVLAALIIRAVWNIIAQGKLRYARRVSRAEFSLGVLTFAGVIFIDVLPGMLIGVVCAVLLTIYQSTRPHVSNLGRVPHAVGAYSDMTRHPENLPVPGILILRLDAPLYYANAITVRDQFMQFIKQTDPPPKALLIDASIQDNLDITSSEMLKSLIKLIRNQGIEIYFAEVHSPVLEFGSITGLLDLIDEDHLFPTVDMAVREIEKSFVQAGGQDDRKIK
jgi:high affinity sulfate transporter 1